MGHTIDAQNHRQCVLDQRPFLLLVQKNVVMGVSLTDKVRSGEDTDAQPKIAGITPVSGLQNTYDADYDPTSNELFYLEHGSAARLIAATIVSDSRVFRTDLSSSNRSQFLTSPIPNDPYCIAYDWSGRNLYVGNKISQNIEVVRTQGPQVIFVFVEFV
jgi:hypothetical protein